MLGSIDIKVRPIRLAYLVDPQNAEQAREAIRLSSTLWGGGFFPILPLYKRMPATWRDKPFRAPRADQVVLGFIEAFDPDILVQFTKDAPPYISGLGLRIVKPDEIWEHLDRGLAPQFGVGVFELLRDVYEKHFRYKAKYPVSVVLPRIPKQLSLFWASWFGEVSPQVYPALEKYAFEALEIEAVDFEPSKLREILERRVLFPTRLIRHGLHPSNRGGRRRDAYVYVLDAAKVEDVVDLWNLRALGKLVLPMPKQLRDTPDFMEMVVSFLKEHRRHWQHDRQHCDYATILRSRGTTFDELKEYARTLRIEPEPGDPSRDPYFALQTQFPRVWDEWARDKDDAVPDDIYGEEETSIEVDDPKGLRFRFRPIVPKGVEKYARHNEPRWANEMGFRFFGSGPYLAEALPKSSGEKYLRSISGLVSHGEWRVGRNGLVKLVRSDLAETRHIPDAESTLFAWLTDLGWKPEVSPSGLLAKQMLKVLEGNVLVLQNEKLLGLLEHMSGGPVKVDGTPLKENTTRQERELPVDEVRNRITSSDRHGELVYKQLLERGVFKLGPQMQCPRCLRHSWFSLDDIGRAFTCPKCLDEFAAIGHLDKANWHYRATGPFSVPGYADGAYAVLLTLEFFDSHKMYSLRRTPVVNFKATSRNRKDLEVDFALFWEETLYGERKDGILFGECKTFGEFGRKDFDRMRYLGKTFPGAVLVFSTLRKTLSPREIRGIARIAKAGRRYWKAERPVNPVLVLTGTELLSWLRPPTCWDEGIRRKFQHFDGLFGLSNATQQIYLKLPPWHEDWRKRWEQRDRNRRRPLSGSSGSVGGAEVRS